VFKDLVDLFFPPVCEACKTLLTDNESVICTQCRHELPVTNFHFTTNDLMKKLLYGRVKLENATALLHFSKKGLVQGLLHNLKYRGHEQIGHFLGQWLGDELKSLQPYTTIDIVVPVPLHKRKLRKRGYNQVTKFGKAIAKALNADFNDSQLIKVRHAKTQVFKDRIKRYDDAQTRFALRDATVFHGKHVLLVDDLITTGATIEACALLFPKNSNIKLSVATIAIAD